MRDDILDIGIESDRLLIPASKSKRFVNFTIDYIFFMLTFFSIGILGALTSETAMMFFEKFENSWFLERIVGMLAMALYYTLLETGLKGKTIGKYITNTRVVNIDGSEPTLNTIALRSLSRIVPFEAFSFFGESPDGWHDRWTDTMVIDEALSTYYD